MLKKFLKKATRSTKSSVSSAPARNNSSSNANDPNADDAATIYSELSSLNHPWEPWPYDENDLHPNDGEHRPRHITIVCNLIGRVARSRRELIAFLDRLKRENTPEAIAAAAGNTSGPNSGGPSGFGRPQIPRETLIVLRAVGALGRELEEMMRDKLEQIDEVLQKMLEDIPPPEREVIMRRGPRKLQKRPRRPGAIM